MIISKIKPRKKTVFFLFISVVMITLILWFVRVYNRPLSEITGWIPQSQFFDGVEMVLVPVGCFTMGRSETQAQYTYQLYPRYPVNFLSDQTPSTYICFDKPFLIDKYLVTNEQFDYFGGTSSLISPWKGQKQPKVMISWIEASDFCKSRGGRLPSESEWEYTAKGPYNWIYPWGDLWDQNNVPRASYFIEDNNAVDQPATVGSKSMGASWTGAMDMVGNVWQWTESIFKPYPFDSSSSTINHQDLDLRSQFTAVIRGGSWFHEELYLQTTYRGNGYINYPTENIGFRCVIDVSSEVQE